MKRVVSNTDGFTLHGWMVTILGLGGNELLVFALVHQFTQSKAGFYTGGVAYLQSWTKWSKNTCLKYLKELVDRGLLQEKKGKENGVDFCYYELGEGVQNLHSPRSKFAPRGVQNLHPYNNKKESKDISPDGDNITPISPSKKFDFRAALIALGVTVEVADAWLQVRKAKKGVNTEIAFRSIQAEIAKSGRSADECIRISVERSWAGFKASWLEDPTPSPRPKKGDSFGRMVQVGRDLGIIETPLPYDEQ